MKFKNYNDSGVQCPYCDYVPDDHIYDIELMNGNEEIVTCDSCEKDFVGGVEFTFTSKEL